MKITKLNITETYGIDHLELDGKSVELRGGTGAGKTSVIDSIKLLLTNKSNRKFIVKQGAVESQLFIQTDNGIEVNRKKRLEGSDYNKVSQHNKEIGKAQSFLNEIFTPLQLNPIEFSQWDEKTQNKALLNLIQFDWDLNWIKEQFGELPKGVNYDQHILHILEEIASENGLYWKNRAECNKAELYKRQAVHEMAQEFPDKYDVAYWEKYDLLTKSEALHKQNQVNDQIKRAQSFIDNYNNKVRGLQADKEIKIASQTDTLQAEKNGLLKSISDMENQIALAKQQLETLDSSLTDKIKIIEADYNTAVAKLEKDIGTAKEYAEKDIVDTSELQKELNEAMKMKEFVSGFKTMKAMETERQELLEQSEYYNGQIVKARELPGKVLELATIPVQGLTVEKGVPLINGLPISNLSDGERIELCVDITLAQKENNLEIILLNGVEQLDDTARNRLYSKCKEKGLQIIAARTTNDSELTIVEL